MLQIIAYGIIRPDANGQWSAYNNEDHGTFGFDLSVGTPIAPSTQPRGLIQDEDSLRVYLLPTVTKFGAVHIQRDDGFEGSLYAGPSGGLQCIRIELRAKPVEAACYPPMNPKHVWRWLDCLGPHPRDNGNLFISVFSQK